MSERDQRGRAPALRRAKARDRLGWVGRYLADRSGAVSPILVVSLVAIIGALGMGVEVSNWWLTQRMLQNAADSAVIAAAVNGGTTCSGGTTACGASSYTSGCSTGSNYFDCEAVAAAAGEGVVNGSANVSVYPQYLTSGCPGTLSACYKVTITRSLPIHLLSILGYSGSSGSQIVRAAAVGGVKAATTPDCIISLATGNVVGVTVNGGSNVDLNGCSVRANGDPTGGGGNSYAVNCNQGSGIGATYISAPGALDSRCGGTQVTGAAAVSDPYEPLDKSPNIPNDPCGGSYPQEPKNGTLASSNQLSGPVTWAATKTLCGDIQLTGDVTINSSTTVVIYNGRLDLNGHKLASASGQGVTIIFTGQNSFGSGPATTPYHNFTGTGTLQIAAPTSGTWSGVAVYQTPYQTTTAGVQRPSTTPTTWPCTASQCLVNSTISSNTINKEGSNSNSLDIVSAGSSPNLWVQGAFYFPNANVTVSGAIDNYQGLTTNGCFLLITGSVTLNGQGSIFQNAQSQCVSDGVTQVFGAAYTHVLYE